MNFSTGAGYGNLLLQIDLNYMKELLYYDLLTTH
jgi:hypothetical protein